MLQVIFRWKDPSNNEVRTEIVPLSGVMAKDTFYPTIAGSWTVIADLQWYCINREIKY